MEVDNVPCHMGTADSTDDLQCANHYESADRETMSPAIWMGGQSPMGLKCSVGGHFVASAGNVLYIAALAYIKI